MSGPTSSLQQLIAAGILDKDFEVLEQTPEPEVEYHDVLPTERERLEEAYLDMCTGLGVSPTRSSAARPTTQAPDDLLYYRTVGYHWLYSGGNYGWWHFAKNDNEKLETQYRQFKTAGGSSGGYALKICGHPYYIDFNEMTQRGSGKMRQLLRVSTLEDIALKGIAGSRITKRDITTPATALTTNNFTHVLYSTV